MQRTNLKVFRIQQKLTQEEIAEKIGCTRSTYSAIESGIRNGRHNFWNAMQKAFGIDESEMWKLTRKDDEI